MDLKDYFDTLGIKGTKQQVMADAIATALMDFCSQEAEFEQAVMQSGKTFQECLDAVADGTGKSISDIRAYRKAVSFYFTGATVQFTMKICLCEDDAEPVQETEKKTVSLSLDSLLDF